MADITTLGMAVDSSGVRRATDDLNKMAPAGKKAADSATELEKSMRRAATEGVVLGEAIGQAIVQVGRLAAQFVQLGLSVGRYQDIAEKTGSSDPAGIARLRTDADVAGVQVESLGLALNRMTLQLSRAGRESSPAAKSLQLLGIEAEKFKNLTIEQQFREIALALDKYADSQDKAVVLQALIGRGGAEQLVLMKELAKNIEPVVRLTNEQIRAADDLNDSLRRDLSTLKQVTEFMAIGALPALDAVTKALKDAALEALGFDQRTKELDNTKITEFAFGVAESFAFIADSVRGSSALVVAVAHTMAAGVAQLKEFFFTSGFTSDDKDRALENIKTIGDAWRKEMADIVAGLGSQTMQERVAENIRAIRERMARAEQPPTTGDFSRLDRQQRLDASGINTPEPKARIKDTVDAYTKLIQSANEYSRALGRELADQDKLTKGEQDLQRALEELANSKSKHKGIEEQALIIQYSSIIQTEKEIETRKRLAREMEAERNANRAVLGDLAQQTDAAVRSADAAERSALTFGMKKDEIEAYQIQLLRATAAELDYAASVEESNDANSIAVQLMRERAGAMRREADAREKQNVKETVAEMSEFAKQAARNIQDTLGSTLERALSGHFENIGQMWASMIRRMIAEALAAKLNEALFGDLGATGWGLIGRLFLGGISGQTAAASNGSWDVLPPASGMSAGAPPRITVQQNITNHIDSSTDRAQTAQLVQQGVVEGNKQMIDTLRVHGVLG